MWVAPRTGTWDRTESGAPGIPGGASQLRVEAWYIAVHLDRK